MNRKSSNPFLAFMLVCYGYEELIGIANAKASYERVRDELKEYNLFAVMEMITKTTLLINSWDVTNKKIQIIILKILFPIPLLRRLLFELQKRVDNENWIILNEHSLTVLMKMAILYCPISGGQSINASPDKEKFGIWNLMLNNLICKEETNRLLRPYEEQKRTQLRRALARYQFNRIEERLSFKFTRYYWIFNYLKKNYRKQIDVEKLFKEATGVSFESYLSVCFALFIKSVNTTSKPLSIEAINDQWLTCVENYLSKTILKKRTVKLAIKHLVGEPDQLRKLIQSEAVFTDSPPTSFYYDTKAFSRFPLIGSLETGCVILTEPRFLHDRACEGAYWIV